MTSAFFALARDVPEEARERPASVRTVGPRHSAQFSAGSVPTRIPGTDDVDEHAEMEKWMGAPSRFYEVLGEMLERAVERIMDGR